MAINELKEIDRKIIDRLLPRDEEEVRKTNAELTAAIEEAGKSWLSKRLKYLTEEGFVEVEKDGRKKYYSLSEDRSRLLRLMNIKEKDSEFIKETSVEDMNISSRAVLGSLRDSNFAEYNRVERANPSDFNLNISQLERELGEEMTAEEILLFVADKLFHDTDDIRETLSAKYEELVFEFFEGQEAEQVLEVRKSLLDVFLDDTEYLMGSVGAGVKTTLSIGSEEIEITGDSVGDVYSSVSNNEVFPEVDSEIMENFLDSFENEVREALKSAIVLRNF